MRGNRRLSTRILRLQLVILCVTLVVGFALSLGLVRQLLIHQFEERALAVARSVSVEPGIASGVLAHDPHGEVERRAEQVRKATGALFVVVADRHGVRYSHPNPAEIGQRVSTDPSGPLSGRTVVNVEKGTLGLSARAKVPLRAGDGDIVGEVSVGIDAHEVDSRLLTVTPSLALYLGAALAVGVVASLVLARRLKRQTFGLELGEIAALLQEREAMLYGIREGVVALDGEERIRLVNDEARRLLDLRASALGEPLTSALPAGRLRDVLADPDGGPDEVVLTEDQCLVVNRMPVRLQDKDLGSVITLSDRTEVENLLRELDSVRGLTDALRAQQHEFANRVHALAGMLELGRYAEATDYALELSGADAGLAQQLQERIDNPQMVGLLVAKAVVAGERGVAFTLTDDSALAAHEGDSRAMLTVLGNLVDNAIDAASSQGAGGRVTVRIAATAADEPEVVIAVTDNGPGIPPERLEQVFADGYSTKPTGDGRRRGLGLALVQRTVRQHRGQVEVSTEGATTFTVRLPVQVSARHTVVNR